LLAGCGGSSGNSGGGGGGGGNQPTAVTFTSAAAAPVAVAAQVGTGAFTSQTLSSGSFTLSIPDGTSNFAVAYVCPAQTSTVGGTQTATTLEEVLELSTRDGTAFSLSCPKTPATPANGILTGKVDVSAIPTANSFGIVAGNDATSVEYMISGVTGSLNASLPAGNNDRVGVVAYDYTAANPSGAFSNWTALAVRNLTGVAIPGSLNGGNPVVLGPGDATSVQPISYSSVPSGYTAPTTSGYYLWSGGGGIVLSFAITDQYPAVPASASETGDFYQLLATTRNPSTVGESATVITNTSTAGPVNVTFPAPWTYAGPTVAAWPTFSFAYNGFAGAAKVTYVAGMTWPTSSTSGMDLIMAVSANHLGGSTTVSIPDLTALAGFAPKPATGTLVNWSALIEGGVAAGVSSSLSNGTVTYVSNGGLYTAP
jgi:hypothetical protein